MADFIRSNMDIRNQNLRQYQRPFGEMSPSEYRQMIDSLESFQRDAFEYNAFVQRGDWDGATDRYLSMREKYGNDPSMGDMLYSLREPVNEINEEYDERLPEFVNNFRMGVQERRAKLKTFGAFNGIGEHVKTIKDMWNRAHSA